MSSSAKAGDPSQGKVVIHTIHHEILAFARMTYTMNTLACQKESSTLSLYFLSVEMDIFVNVATAEKNITFFDQEKILHSVTWTETGKESKWVLPTISDFAEHYGEEFGKDVENIIVVNGPGSFTGIRVAVSVVNTLLYLYPTIQAKELTVGELYASYRTADLFLFQLYESDTFIFDKQGILQERISDGALPLFFENKTIVGELLPSTLEKLHAAHLDFQDISSEHMTLTILENILKKASPVECITPFYGKGANITTPKQR